MISNNDKVLLGHGSGGVLMKNIIEDFFIEAYGDHHLREGDDAAALDIQEICKGIDTPSKLSFSTDSFVVSPHFFPGGNIGDLAVCGTVNDVATKGARPLYLTCSFILEEGFPLLDLKKICSSIAKRSAEAGVSIVTGDTKVVNKGKADGIFINTAGIGVLPSRAELSGKHCKPGDKIILTGSLGDHGITIMSCRESLSFSTTTKSDVAPLNHMITRVIDYILSDFPDAGTYNTPFPIKCFRDPTRGGLASTLNELSQQSHVDICINESSVPVSSAVQNACDMLGYDVFQVANEGKMVCVVDPSFADNILNLIKEDCYGKNASIIGTIQKASSFDNPKVYIENNFGGKRVLDMIVGEQLPRIC